MRTSIVERLEDRLLLSAGSLDTSFNGTGKKLLALSAGAQINAVAIDASNQFTYVAGSSGGNMVVWRFKVNGALDANFGTAGKVAVDFGGTDVATAVAVQPNGDIVLAGYTNFHATINDFAVARLTPYGDLDSNFGVNGLDTTDFGFDDRATCLGFLSDGSIVVGGYDDGGKADFAVACFANLSYYPIAISNPLGFEDGEELWQKSFTFGTGLYGGVEKANALAIGAGDKIVLAGYTDAGGGGNNFALARLNSSDGSFDKTFNATGKKIVDFGFNDQASSVAIQSDGKIVAAGFDDGGQADFAAVRLNSNGSLDTTFNHKAIATSTNGNGKISFTFGAGAFGGVEKATGVAVITGGKILLGGYTDAGGTPNNFALARLTSAGVLDTTFGTAGKVITNLGADDHAILTALPDGRAILAGTSKTTRTTSLALARYTGDIARLGSIAGSVFNDYFANGIKDLPDDGLSVPVFVDLNRNGVWDGNEPGTSQLTSNFNFTGLAPGSYLVRPMPGYPDYRITTAATAIVNLAAGAKVTGVLFGFTQLALIRGVVFADKNGNTKQDTGEQGLGGWTVFLDSNSNGKLDTGEISTVTSSTGAYSFNVKADTSIKGPAKYHVWIVQKSGFKRIAPSSPYFIDVGEFALVFNGLNFAEKPTTLPG